ncbi:MAG: hypothetical protein RR048_05885, partial [Oscillospiraceae bacterium]
EDKNGIGHFYNHGKKGEEICKKILDRLRVSNNDKKLILTLIRYHSDVITDEKSNIKTWLKILGKEDFIRLLHVRYADCMAKERETSKQNLLYLSKICAVFKDIMDNDECYCIKQLSINGDDILNLHICPPQKIGQLLDFALNAVIEERAENKKDNLIRYIKKLGNMV